MSTVVLHLYSFVALRFSQDESEMSEESTRKSSSADSTAVYKNMNICIKLHKYMEKYFVPKSVFHIYIKHYISDVNMYQIYV